MCEHDILENGEAQEFLDKTFDFLYPVSADEVPCKMGMCANSMNECQPSLFQCRVTENQVTISGMGDADIEKARLECAARNTCGIEPVGGEGGIIETPIRDDALAQDIYDRRAERHNKIDQLQVIRITLIAAAVIVCILACSKQ